MEYGFIKTAAVTTRIRVADCSWNAGEICRSMKEAAANGAKLIVFPELCLTGASCQDLFYQEKLVAEAKHGLYRILFESRGLDAVIVVGLPWELNQKLYNTAAVLSNGDLLGLVPKQILNDDGVSMESRIFASGEAQIQWAKLEGRPVPFGRNLLFTCAQMPKLTFGVEIGTDLLALNAPGITHACAGAAILVHPCAVTAEIGRDAYYRTQLMAASARLLGGYVSASAGDGESTTDVLYTGARRILEKGKILEEGERFTTGILYGDIDVERLGAERKRSKLFIPASREEYQTQTFRLEYTTTVLSRTIPAAPFVPEDEEEQKARFGEILTIQALGLKKRMEHIRADKMVVGISGGLDSTLALLVMAKCCDLMGRSRDTITAITMPGFGTTGRTYRNACTLTEELGAVLKEINICEAVKVHLADIGHPIEDHSVVYENAQARERMQVLMDAANKENALVVGTGDLSELVLGWTTFNGDHMSMYGVNGSVPKTLIRPMLAWYASVCENSKIGQILKDILDTPVSPELLPPDGEQIAQKTETLNGPYELHDFFLYYVLRHGFSPAKILHLAKAAFGDRYSVEEILKWLKRFYQRFVAAQFKRSCLPDGVSIGSVGISPRGGYRMPSDACATVWVKEVNKLEAFYVRGEEEE